MAKLSYDEVLELIRFDDYQQIVAAEEIFNLGIECKWNSIIKNLSDKDVDPVDIYQDEAAELQKMIYHNKLMNICLLCEFWEQDLYNFMKMKNYYTVPDNSYKNVKDAFNVKFTNCNLDSDIFPKIKEMRKLVNAIKHGVGTSLKDIRTLTSDNILADSSIGYEDSKGRYVKKKQIDYDCNTLTSRTLNVDGKLKEYHAEIIKFWDKVNKEVENKKDNSK